ncbi:thioredoxin C-1 [Arctopsyche grandis]|uniref:thioredoxin C-1 n=1 Tax=Arctopsyche grandis TaxID=121162 RepID=UPI00406D9D77
MLSGAVVCRSLWGAATRGAQSRHLSVSTRLWESFKVQDVQDFEERVKKSSQPIVVDFFATWCNPCRLLTPRIESIVDEYKGKIKLAKVDIDQNTDLALDYEVQSVPVLLVMRNGLVEQRLVGLQDLDKLRKFVGDAVSKDSNTKT